MSDKFDNKFAIPEFNLESMVQNPSILIVAKRGSGKSYITRDILHHYRDVPGGVVISPTDKMSSFYKYFFPDLYIHYNINEMLLKKIIYRQSMMMDKKEAGFDPSAILLMDDCLARKSWGNDESIMEILMNSRHYCLTNIVTVQTPMMGFTPDVLLNFDYIFLLKEDSTINKRRLWSDYGSIFPTLDSFEKVFNACTSDYQAMVIDNRKPSDNIQEKIFWYKAQERKFAFGSNTFTGLHHDLYDPEYKRKNPFGAPAPSINTTTFDKDYLFDYFMNQDKINTNKIANRRPLAEEAEEEKSDISNADTDYLFDYFMNETMSHETSKKHAEEVCSEPDLTEPDLTEPDLSESGSSQADPSSKILRLSYKDNTYDFFLEMAQPTDRELIKILCQHIENIKNNNKN